MIALVCDRHNHIVSELDIANLVFAQAFKILLFELVEHILAVNLVLSLGNAAVVMLIDLDVA